ncbi:hypothetical protein HOH51_00585 [bacterium]|jgi:prephenate dehydratase|nr:hypothetical protein [bacterium]
MQILTLGPKFSGSYKIAEKYFPNSIKTPTEKPEDLLNEIIKNKELFALVPIKNPATGVSTSWLQRIINHKAHIWDTLTYSPKLCLASQSREITTIVTTPEYFEMSKDVINKEFKQLRVFQVPDVKNTIEHCLYNKQVAGILPIELSQLLKLESLAENLNNPQESQVTFALINANPNHKIKNKSLIGITFEHSKSTNHLLNILHPFKEHNVEIYNVYSLPQKDKQENQSFCFEIQGDLRQARFRQIKVFLERDLKICQIHELGGQTNMFGQ